MTYKPKLAGSGEFGSLGGVKCDAQCAGSQVGAFGEGFNSVCVRAEYTTEKLAILAQDVDERGVIIGLWAQNGPRRPWQDQRQSGFYTW